MLMREYVSIIDKTHPLLQKPTRYVWSTTDKELPWERCNQSEVSEITMRQRSLISNNGVRNSE